MYIENGRHVRLQSQCQRVLLTRQEVPNKGVIYCQENDNESEILQLWHQVKLIINSGMRCAMIGRGCTKLSIKY